jgi:hypothetical protein
MIDYQRQVNQALHAAKYHEDAAFLAVKDHNPDKATIHVRAYLWELQSAWDYTLLHANSRSLHLDTRRVRADNFLDKLERTMPAYSYLARLRSIQTSAALKRVGRLRNEAHRFVTSLRHAVIDKDKRVTAFGIAAEDSPAIGIVLQRDELTFLRSAIDALTRESFFA